MAEVITLKTDYDQQTADLTITQFRRDKYLEKLAGYNAQLLEIEVVLQQLLIERWLDTAVGAQLDIVGAIVNIARDDQVDPVYRDAIRAGIALVYSGTSEAIIEIILTVYGGTFVTLRNTFPGKFHITTDATVTSNDLIPITMAGIGGYVETNCLVDAVGNFIVDYDGENICVVLEQLIVYLVDADNNTLLDATGDFIITFE